MICCREEAESPPWPNARRFSKVSGLRRAFGPNTIFDKFNLEVRTGEAIALTGRNGAGKSTLLRCLVGADRADDGNVEVCGNPMTETSPEIRRDVATVIDDLDFFPDLSVVEHLDLLARAHGIAEPDEVVDEVLEEVQLVLNRVSCRAPCLRVNDVGWRWPRHSSAHASC